jgi:methylated-DNA-[protein]-cysteine S-methyltransferase
MISSDPMSNGRISIDRGSNDRGSIDTICSHKVFDDMAHNNAKSDDILLFERMDSPIGVLTIAADAGGLRHIEFPQNRHPVSRAGWRACDAQSDEAVRTVLQAARTQLSAYFAGKLRDFNLPLAPRGTAFQCEVWRMLGTIPFGATWSYGRLAQAIGKPAAVRAVGAANGRNPLPIVLPCHRVIGANGELVGFGGGLPIKAALLALEGVRGIENAAGTQTMDDLFD